MTLVIDRNPLVDNLLATTPTSTPELPASPHAKVALFYALLEDHVIGKVLDVVLPQVFDDRAGSALPVRVERLVLDDEIDQARHNTEIGTRFFCGDGDSKIEAYSPDDENEPFELFFPGHGDALDVDFVERFLSLAPQINALLSDPRVQAARYGLKSVPALMALPTEPRQKRKPNEFTLTIGQLDGYPVMACYRTEDNALLWANVDWNGHHFSTDGETYINVGADTSGAVGDMTLHEWGQVRELAQIDIVERFIALARKHQTAPQR